MIAPLLHLDESADPAIEAVDQMSRWATTPDAGAVVTFAGTVRDHAPGRDGVTSLTYEAWDDVAVRRLHSVVDDVRARFLTDMVALNIDLFDASTIPPRLDASAWPGVPAVFAALVGALPKEVA